MLKCAIIDDEPLAVQLLENYVEKIDFLSLVGSWNDPVLALNSIKELRPDLLFLDIQMPDLDGLELSKMIPEETKVIFTTAFKQYAFDSYEVSALDFLLKPVRFQKFLAASEKARVWFEMKTAAQGAQTSSSDPQPRDYIFVKVDGSMRKVSYKDILYVEGMKDYVIVRTVKERMVTHNTMKAVEEELPSSEFMRVHRSYIINLEHIESVSGTGDVLVGGQCIHVSDAYRLAFDAYIKGKVL